MTRTKSKLTLATAFFAMLLGTTMLSAPAFADTQIWEELNDDGSVTVLYKSADGSIWALMYEKDGSVHAYIPGGESNPDDTSTGKGSHSDRPDVIGMIKSGKATYTIKIAPADSAELISHLSGDGGLGPHYNPGDTDNGQGPGAAPTHSMEVKKTQAEIKAQIATLNAVAKALAVLDTSMGSGDEGSGEGPTGFNKGGGKGGKPDDNGNYSEGQNKTIGKTEKDLLGPRPAVVNPPHLNKVGRTSKTSTSNNDQGTTLSVTGKGLLDGGGAGGGFNQNGPSSAGSAAKGAGSRGAARIR